MGLGGGPWRRGEERRECPGPASVPVPASSMSTALAGMDAGLCLLSFPVKIPPLPKPDAGEDLVGADLKCRDRKQKKPRVWAQRMGPLREGEKGGAVRPHVLRKAGCRPA